MDSTTLDTPDGLALSAAHHHADSTSRGTALLAHGITQDMDEGGMYVRLADRLTDAGFDVVRFTFRGHGDSDGTSAGVTVGGELLDFQTAFEHARERFDGPHVVVAKSFGAVSTCLSLDRYADDVAGVALWNPVLDVDGTFLDPKAAWGRRNFTGDRLTELRETGTISLDGGFEFGRVLYEELHRYDPGGRLVDTDVPALVVHGDADEIVPYEDARRVADQAGADFHTVEDANHGFVAPDDDPGDEREQDAVTVDWLVERVED